MTEWTDKEQPVVVARKPCDWYHWGQIKCFKEWTVPLPLGHLLQTQVKLGND